MKANELMIGEYLGYNVRYVGVIYRKVLRRTKYRALSQSCPALHLEMDR